MPTTFHAYCLGHREFVSCIEYIEDLDLLISASGDCSVRVWDLQGKQLCETQCVPYHPLVEATREAGGQEAGDISREDGSQKVATPERQRPAIQRLAYCSHCRCLAVSFYSCPQVMMYQLTAAGGHAALTHAQTIPLTADAWDITFEGDVLWVLSPVEGATLTAYHVDTREAGDGIQLTEINDSGSSAFQVTKAVNSKWDFFKDALHVASPVPTLWKIASQANVVEYQQRKEKRLQEHSSKRAANSPRERRLPGKKARNTS
ncbi:tRNA (guanine-N(7)-)-methyltransferase non-catalytic subunit WDR4-like isoform X1 [Pomacea canaliculata]|uniref:tRNA (guanine-N(7)-)-methyltransferase non-catalytic subunit WDR4-like isoform X1 n=1 Tax=Pomacea canaliculata TaxID=400727 RepID=UPI000D737747|nr:tRNA (guanine-N(7)-)-methyltransferase non-catalytic subunit WDR4-like isoform X1 [Pomacea canaliculata]